MGPVSHRVPEAWFSERGHYRPERPRPGVPDGGITDANGRGLVFRTGTLQARTAEAWCCLTGTLQDRTAEAWCSERGHYRPERPNPGVPDVDITGQNGRGLVFPEGDITGPSGQGLVFPDGDITGPDSQHGFRRVGTVGF